MEPNFTYRKINPVYTIKRDGNVFDTRTMKLIKPNKDTLFIKLETINGDYTSVKIYSIYAIAILGSRSRTNKKIARIFYTTKFKE